MLFDAAPATDLDQADRHRDEHDADQQDDHLEHVRVDDRFQPTQCGIGKDYGSRQQDSQRKIHRQCHLQQLAARDDLAADEGKPGEPHHYSRNRAGAAVETRFEKVACSQTFYPVCPALYLGHHQERHHDDAEARNSDQPRSGDAEREAESAHRDAETAAEIGRCRRCRRLQQVHVAVGGEKRFAFALVIPFGTRDANADPDEDGEVDREGEEIEGVKRCCHVPARGGCRFLSPVIRAIPLIACDAP